MPSFPPRQYPFRSVPCRSTRGDKKEVAGGEEKEKRREMMQSCFLLLVIFGRIDSVTTGRTAANWGNGFAVFETYADRVRGREWGKRRNKNNE